MRYYPLKLSEGDRKCAELATNLLGYARKPTSKQPQVYIGVDPAIPGKDYSCYCYMVDGELKFCSKSPYPYDNINPIKSLQAFVNMIPFRILKQLLHKWFK